MAERVKASRYNHFVDLENGKRLAFNAMTCGLAEMDEESYRRYCDVDGTRRSQTATGRMTW